MGKKGNVNLTQATGAIPDIPNGYTPETKTIFKRVRVVEVPLVAANPEDYQARHVEIGALSPIQRKALKEATQGLIEKRAPLNNGKIVKNATDTIRYILEQIASEEASTI